MHAIDSERLVQTSDCYKLLSAALYEPDKALFLEENLCANLKALLEALAPAAAQGALRMQAGLEAESQEDLVLEHAALFIGPFSLLAAPYGSIYLDGERRLMGDSTMVAVRQYREAGLELKENDVPDHIAFELEFLHYLAAEEAGAVAAGDKARQEECALRRQNFLKQCLGGWVSPFCAAIRAHTKSGFYAGLADCLEGFVRAECQRPVHT